MKTICICRYIYKSMHIQIVFYAKPIILNRIYIRLLFFFFRRYYSLFLMFIIVIFALSADKKRKQKGFIRDYVYGSFVGQRHFILRVYNSQGLHIYLIYMYSIYIYI